MRSAGVAAAVLLGLLGPAYAADAPNIIGLWTAVAHAGSNLSIAPMDDMRLRVDTPHFSNRPGTEAWNVRIDTQSDRAFGGAVVSKGGKEQVLLGTFRSDGKRVVYATDFSSGDGEVSADSMELCWIDSVPNYIATACTTYERAKPAPAVAPSAPAGK
ncbi:MAG TPA: hypothetical protein PLK13_06720 [Xanthobacteraceae bacterium]|jgi:hypothetical protein|uniref:hypothetical protein n=1 Tax=Roseixanthobacter finlandensis TaxID=3119922 RepID=UPI000BCF7DEC|nr:MAG: hypothetical protein B7Y61_17035 [Rhizobiales bacterium 35-66-30]HQS08502.1 hypothetical protein [Xanthobacteraceae bacterium]HQS48122.1 hypothetical protein [Xanthobacteraceae bacterium]